MKEVNSAFPQVTDIIETAKNSAYKKVNEELINMYWNIGAFLSKEAENAAFGDAYIDSISEYIQEQFPGIKGFNRRGLYRMKKFYETYVSDEFVTALLTQISWTKVLLEPIKGLKENPFMDTYVMEFLDMPQIYKEQDFRKALIHNMKDFILELGKDFTFIDEEYRVQVGGEDFAIDLLFFHRGLQCLVAFELKIGKFKPEYISKMDFYLEALDRQKKKEHENPSVGLILCASKNDEVVEYAMSRSMSPMLVSEYKLQLPDKKILEKKLQELVNISQIEKE